MAMSCTGNFLPKLREKMSGSRSPGTWAQKDGYATFEPTEFKVGDLNVPVSLVNPALQRKLAEQRDRLKLSDTSQNSEECKTANW